MPKIHFQGADYELAPKESVLDCLLRHGQQVPCSCHAGACQSCMMKVLDGTPCKASTLGLKDTLKAQGGFLPCQWRPEDNISVELLDYASTTIECLIVETIDLNHQVKAVRLHTTTDFPCVSGQYITLLHDNIARSYSIANLPEEDGYIELHVRRVDNGLMSQWLFNDAKQRDVLHIRGPAGNCFYVPGEDKAFPIILAGTGTGLAPLYGIILDALRHKHEGPIHLFHGALVAEDLYLTHELEQLAKQHANFHYMPCVLQGEPSQTYLLGDIQEIVLENLADPTDLHVYLCGDPEFVKTLKKKVFLAGANLKNIYSDAFLPSKA